MKRRDFLRSTAAVAATPALPARLLADGVSIAPADYARVVKWVHKWTMASAGAVKSAFGLDQTTADALFEQLQSDGILRQANSHGLARAVKPWFKDPLTVARSAPALPTSERRGKALRDAVKRAFDAPDTPSDTVAEADSSPPCHEQPDPSDQIDPSGANPSAPQHPIIHEPPNA